MSAEAPRPRRSRKSIAIMPTEAAAKEGLTTSITPPEVKKPSRKSRSKSMGPGGLAALNSGKGALKEGNGNGRRISMAPQAAPKSILKPTLPLSPIQQIPEHKSKRTETIQYNGTTNTLNFDPPPVKPATTVPVKSEEEQQKRAEILAQRDARRQSLGNRRVSFAPEATLHTWDVVEYYKDNDSSSATATSTPASSRSGHLPFSSPTNGPPSTPPEQVEHEPPETPPNARTEHQWKHRRSSAQASELTDPPSSPLTESAVASPFSNEGSPEIDTLDSSDDEIAERTFMSLGADTTMADVTAGIGMGLDATDGADDDFTGAFKPYFKKPSAWKFEGETAAISTSPDAGPSAGPPKDVSIKATVSESGSPIVQSPNQTESKEGSDDEVAMDETRPVGTFLSPSAEPEDMTMGMDFTYPLGGILNQDRRAQQTRPSIMRQPPQNSADDMTMGMDFTQSLGGILAGDRSARPRPSVAFQLPQCYGDMTMGMDFTKPLGGIMGGTPESRRESLVQDQTMAMDADMEFTRPIGRILPQKNEIVSPTPSRRSEDENDGMTMEFTSVMGGIMGGSSQQDSRRSSGRLMNASQWAQNQAKLQAQQENAANAPAEPSVQYPTLPAPEDVSSPVEQPASDGMTMDITESLGEIALAQLPASIESAQATIAQSGADTVPPPAASGLRRSPVQEVSDAAAPAPNRRRSGRLSGEVAPPVAFTPEPRRNRRSSGRKSLEAALSDVSLQDLNQPPVTNSSTPQQASTILPDLGPKLDTPKTQTAARPATPPLQKSPLINKEKPKTPSKKLTPITSQDDSEAAEILSAARRRLEVQRSPSPRKASAPRRSTSPQKASTPLRGVGIDRPGLGSPSVSAKLARRGSLGDTAMTFSPIAFPADLLKFSQEDKKADEEEKELENKRQEEERKSLDIRARIAALTPRKQQRKSLAYGNLLHGKRALEGITEDGDEKKRRKSVDGVDASLSMPQPEDLLSRSAKKLRNVVLPTPQRKIPKQPDLTMTDHTPIKPKTPSKAKTPSKVRFESPKPESMQVEEDEEEAEALSQENSVSEVADDNIPLKEFLDMIDISFLDGLTTSSTRRRQTGFPGKGSLEGPEFNPTLDETDTNESTSAQMIWAGAITTPMLDLYQHSCRELKKYIKEGKDVAREIEADTLEENPLLFKDYISAPPDIKAIMDMQFKNIKTYSRLEAKKIWYEWRTKLQIGIHEGLETHLRNLMSDEKIIHEAQAILNEKLPVMRKEREDLKAELRLIDERLRQLAEDDPEELSAAREQLVNLEVDAEATEKALIAARAQIEAVDTELAQKEQTKRELQAGIDEAERIRELNRGWKDEEVEHWKSQCQELEAKSGWSIIASPEQGVLELKWRRQLKVRLDTKGTNPAAVEYISPECIRVSDPRPMPARLVDYCIHNLSTLLANETEPKKILKICSGYWESALALSEELEKLWRWYHTEIGVDAEGYMYATANVLVKQVRSCMEIGFKVDGRSLRCVGIDARVVYGGLNGEAVVGLLREWQGGWADGVKAVVDRCVVRTD